MQCFGRWLSHHVTGISASQLLATEHHFFDFFPSVVSAYVGRDNMMRGTTTTRFISLSPRG